MKRIDGSGLKIHEVEVRAPPSAGTGLGRMVKCRNWIAAPIAVLAVSVAAAAAQEGVDSTCAAVGARLSLVASPASKTFPGASEKADGGRSLARRSEKPTPRRKPEFLPDVDKLRASTDLRQKWRLGLALADSALLSPDASTRAELMSEAKSVALDLAGIGMKDWLLAEIVDRQIEAGAIAEAREITALIEHPGWKADALILIAHAGGSMAAVALGETQRQLDMNAALCAALRIPDEEWRAAALADLQSDGGS